MGISGFPSSSLGKEYVCNAGDAGRRRFDAWVRKIPWRWAWKPTPVFLPGESHGQRTLAGYRPWGRKEADTTEATKHACMGASLGNPRKGPVAPKFISPHTPFLSVLLLPAAPGLRPGRAGLPVSVQGSLQVSGPKGVGRTRGWARPPTLTPCPSPLSFKEWTLTTSLAQWPSEVSEVSSLPTVPPLEPSACSLRSWLCPLASGLIHRGGPCQELGLRGESRQAGSGLSRHPQATSFSTTEMVAVYSHLGPKPANKEETQQVS